LERVTATKAFRCSSSSIFRAPVIGKGAFVQSDHEDDLKLYSLRRADGQKRHAILTRLLRRPKATWLKKEPTLCAPPGSFRT